jgi:hypothetical protein
MSVCRRVKLISVYKAAAFIVLSGSLLLLPIVSSAQDDLPCDDSNPYDVSCPLDTWVWVLAVIALTLGAWQIYRQQTARTRA